MNFVLQVRDQIYNPKDGVKLQNESFETDDSNLAIHMINAPVSNPPTLSNKDEVVQEIGRLWATGPKLHFALQYEDKTWHTVTGFHQIDWEKVEAGEYIRFQFPHWSVGRPLNPKTFCLELLQMIELEIVKSSR